MNLRFKDDIDIKDLSKLTEKAWTLLEALLRWADNRMVQVKITSLISDRKNIITKSKTHEEGRAFDVSIKGWSVMDVDACVLFFNSNYKEIGALSFGDMMSRPVVFGDPRHLDHMHFQVRP